MLAPLWEVDDFASFLFVTRAIEQSKVGADFAHAVREATDWMRTLSAGDALRHATTLLERLADLGQRGSAAALRLGPQFDEQKEWLKGLDPSDRPFSSPLDWMAFQLTGTPCA